MTCFSNLNELAFALNVNKARPVTGLKRKRCFNFRIPERFSRVSHLSMQQGMSTNYEFGRVKVQI